MNRELIKEGKKPVYMSKAERKAKELVFLRAPNI